MKAILIDSVARPAVTFTSFNPDGTTETKVIKRFGSLFGDVPRPTAEEGNEQ